MPVIKPFRALRYEPDVVGEVALVTSPPYDVIGDEEHRSLLARHPKNVVRLDLPIEELGDDPDERYRRAARTFAAWRSDGTFHKDPRPSLYVYEQTYTVPGSDVRRTQRGFFARLRLEAPGSGGVLPHEATLAAPREDRYKLLRATGANMSPIVGLHGDPKGEVAAILASVAGGASGPPVADIVDGDETRHRMWVVPDAPAVGARPEAGPGEASAGTGSSDTAHAEAATVAVAAAPRSLVAELVALASAGPVTIADGHHRYETALRYRDERRMSRACEEDPPFDYVLMLFLGTDGQQLTVLPTHRVVRALGDNGVAALWTGLAEGFEIDRIADATPIRAAFESAALSPGGRGRFGLWTRSGGAFLTARRAALEPWLPPGGPALRRLDVALLQAALDRLAGIDPAAIVAGGRIAYTKSAAEAIAWVDEGPGGRVVMPTTRAG